MQKIVRKMNKLPSPKIIANFGKNGCCQWLQSQVVLILTSTSKVLSTTATIQYSYKLCNACIFIEVCSPHMSYIQYIFHIGKNINYSMNLVQGLFNAVNVLHKFKTVVWMHRIELVSKTIFYFWVCFQDFWQFTDLLVVNRH